MKLRVTTPYLARVGGAESYLAAILPELQARGVELALATWRGAGDDADRIDVGLKGVPVWSAESLGFDELRTKIAAWRPALVFDQGGLDPFFFEELPSRYPVVLFSHNYWASCVSGTKRHGWPRAEPCSKPLGPACLLHYLPRRCGGLNPVTMISQYRDKRRRADSLPKFHSIVVASRRLREEYLRAGVEETRVRRLPYPVTEERLASPPPPREPSDTILMIGRLTEIKGGRVLIEALRRLRDGGGPAPRLWVAGDGPERERMEADCRSKGIEAVFHGRVDAARRRVLIDASDLVAVPSTWPEPFGLVGLEAACRGVPAVGFDVGGVPDWLEAGVTGELAPGDPPTAEGLADALARALSDPDRLRRMGEAAWNRADQFSVARHVDRLLTHFQEISG